MINPPDELLADLQSALPPDVDPSPSPYPPLANGGGFRPHHLTEDHTYEMAGQEEDDGVMAGYEMPRSSTERSVSPEVSRGREVKEYVAEGEECVFVLLEVNNHFQQFVIYVLRPI